MQSRQIAPDFDHEYWQVQAGNAMSEAQQLAQDMKQSLQKVLAPRQREVNIAICNIKLVLPCSITVSLHNNHLSDHCLPSILTSVQQHPRSVDSEKAGFNICLHMLHSNMRYRLRIGASAADTMSMSGSSVPVCLP